LYLRHFVILLAACSGFASHAEAQRYFNGKREIGLFLGGGNYHGDLAPRIVLSSFRPAVGGLFRYNFNPYISYRAQGSFTEISGNDANYKPQADRNLQFRSVIIEAANTIEFNFHRFGTNVLDVDFSPYLTLGLNVFYFDPRAPRGSDYHHLRNLHTEGRTRKYSNLQLAVPIGFGVKYNMSRNWVIGFEGVWRKTFTDYLDDVKDAYPDYKKQTDDFGQLSADMSHAHTANGKAPFRGGTQRGDTHLKDWYFFLGFTLTYRFTPVICRG